MAKPVPVYQSTSALWERGRETSEGERSEEEGERSEGERSEEEGEGR